LSKQEKEEIFRFFRGLDENRYGKLKKDGNFTEVSKGSIIHVPVECKHQITNLGNEDLIFIEIQLGDYFGEVYYGFFCVGGFYGILGVILYFFLHDWIKERTSNSIVKQMLN
jgi:hypothetical protein